MNDSFGESDIDFEEEIDDGTVSIKYDIASYPSDFTLSGIEQMWRDHDIVIPDYQREFVWTIQQSSLLIDSFLCGLPVPPVFFYVREDNKNLVIDGQQRILSVVYFIEGYFGKESTQGRRQVFRLTGLDTKSPFYNKRFEDLDESDQRKVKQSVLRAVNIRQLTPSGETTSAYHIFERLNTGGTPLKPQEIRNCVFSGNFNKLLKEANKNENWRKIVGKANIDKHQKDVELLLRVFSLVGSVKDYEKPMKEFLNLAMKKHDSGNTKKVISFFNAFSIVSKAIIDSLGDKPFHLRGPLNISALDSVMSILIENFVDIEKIDLSRKYFMLKENSKFIEYTSMNTTDTKTVRDRFNLVKTIMLGK
jgi:uncharacterized protein with ParB-like and HNH nuclease domain